MKGVVSVGGAVGTGKGTGKSMHRRCQNYTELIFGKGMRTATFQFSESGGSLNGPDLLNCLSCRHPYQTPHSLNCLPPFNEKPFFSLKSASPHPLTKIGSELPFSKLHFSFSPILGIMQSVLLITLKDVCQK